MNEHLFLYWEDTEWCLRIQQAGYECHYCPDAIIWHDNGGSTDGSGSDTQIYYQTRNQVWMALHYGTNQAKRALLHLCTKYVQGTNIQRKAVFDAIFGRMGKHVLA
jgi:GT2 family glycosyltransferase